MKITISKNNKNLTITIINEQDAKPIIRTSTNSDFIASISEKGPVIGKKPVTFSEKGFKKLVNSIDVETINFNKQEGLGWEIICSQFNE